MPKLRDYLINDVHTFLNVNDFADLHNINGHDILVVIDEDILKERPSHSLNQAPSDGIFMGDIVLFIKLCDFGDPPVKGELLRLDGKIYTVTAVSKAEGLLEITLEANES